MFKYKKFSFSVILFNVVMALAISAVTGINPVYAIAGVMFISIVLSFARLPEGILRAGVFKELWLDLLMEDFYPDGSFISRSRDMSALVDHNTLHLAEIGVEPNVLIDNTSYPVPTSERSDTAIDLPLQTFDTENTIVRNIDELETAYDKMASVLRQHRNSLMKKAATLAAYNWSPSNGSEFNHVVSATGNPVDGLTTLSFEDVLKMMGIFDDMDLPTSGRVMVLCPQHRASLMAQDIQMYKQVMNLNELFGFKVFTFSKNPNYNAEGNRIDFEAVELPSTIFFHEDEVMRAQGTLEMFAEYKSPAERGDILGFQMRFAALSIRGKYSGAIHSQFA